MGDGEALVQQIAEALARHHGLTGQAWRDFVPEARAVVSLVEAQVAPLRDEVERKRASVAGFLDAVNILNIRLTNANRRADAAESALRQVRELADRWASESSKMAVGLVKQGCAPESGEGR